MLVMCRPFVVACADGPAITVDGDILRTHVDHRLDADAHAWAKQGADAATSVVGDIRVFVESVTDAMTGKLANHRIATLLAVFLHGVTDMTDTITGTGLLDAQIEALLGGAQQAKHLLIDIADREGVAAVAIETIEDSTTVTTDDIAILQHIV